MKISGRLRDRREVKLCLRNMWASPKRENVGLETVRGLPHRAEFLGNNLRFEVNQGKRPGDQPLRRRLGGLPPSVCGEASASAAE